MIMILMVKVCKNATVKKSVNWLTENFCILYTVNICNRSIRTFIVILQ